jgi:hypothetical protein
VFNKQTQCESKEGQGIISAYEILIKNLADEQGRTSKMLLRRADKQVTHQVLTAVPVME